MAPKFLSLLLRSQSLPPDQLQEICYRLIRTIQVYFANKISGRLHILPATHNLEWVEYPTEAITASVVTAGSFRTNQLITPLPETSNPTILVECHLQSLEFGPLFNDLFSAVTLFKQKLTGIFKICGLKIEETRLTWLPLIQ
ncbi:MAG: hypothetical protein ACE5OZ_11015 [Candidatus Heimdallarchaeota archaeon]